MRAWGRVAAFTGDPRHAQIAVQSALLVAGIGWLEFDVTPARAVLLIGGALATQWVCTKAWRLPAFEPRSAFISGLGLSLLLRTDSTAVAVGAAAVTILSKFIIRWRGKHVFNPANFGLVFAALATGGTWGWPGAVWISPGQWGNAAFVAVLMGCAGTFVVLRAARSDVTLAFLGTWAALLFARAVWLGQPAAIPLHQLQNGALLLFAFHMISDPRTTPDSRAGRLLFGAGVAALAAAIQFALYRPSGPFWALALLSPAVPLLDRWLPGRRHAWTATTPAAPVPGRSPA